VTEPQRVRERYARRAAHDPRYHPLQPDVWQSRHERERVLLRWLARLGWRDLHSRSVVEVGCGSGANLLDLLRLGFAPEHLTGLELLPERHAQARRVLPSEVTLWLGDASVAPVAPQSQHIVLQSMVFSSLLDAAFQQRLADTMWRWVQPGGAVLWYDFSVDNPRNADVRGVPLHRVGALFPHGTMRCWRVTLAPPLARAVCRVHPALYGVCNAVPWLRTHALCWIGKPGPPLKEPQA
jgi:SAM-dependent methyltransferase